MNNDRCAWQILLKGFSSSPILKTLRPVSKWFRNYIDEHFLSARKLQLKLSVIRDARHILRNVYIPSQMRQILPDHHVKDYERPAYVEPSPWVISTMTMLSYLSTKVDMRSVYYCLEAIDFHNPTSDQMVDFNDSREETGCIRSKEECIRCECSCLAGFFPGILDVHFEHYCRGNPRFSETKNKKKGKTSDKTFRNQCTMRICMSYSGSDRKNGQEWNIVNVKMFQNGKVQLTGCQSVNQGRGALKFLLEKLSERAPVMRYKRDCMTQIRCFGLGTDALNSAEDILVDQSSIGVEVIRHMAEQYDEGAERYINFLSRLPKHILQKILLYVNNESLFMCRRVNTLLYKTIGSEHFWEQKCCQDIHCKIMYDQTHNAWYMSEKFNGRFNRMDIIRKVLYFKHPMLLYKNYHRLDRHHPFIIVEQYEELFVTGEVIALINSDFKTGYELNLPVLYKILTRNHGLQADYSPDGYVAINLKYVSPFKIDLSAIPEDDRPSFSEETIISFFIFSTGSIILNSAKSIEQQIDAYNFLNNILKQHYEKIWHTNRQKKR
jgi:hypothetical protein